MIYFSILFSSAYDVASFGSSLIVIILMVILFILGADIPGGATLIFDVELLEIKDAPKQENIFKVIDADEDKHLSSDEVRQVINHLTEF